MLQFIRRKVLTSGGKLFNSKIKSLEIDFNNPSSINKEFETPWKDCLPPDWSVTLHDRLLLNGIASHGMTFCDDFSALLENEKGYSAEIFNLLDPDTVRNRIEYLFEFIKNNVQPTVLSHRKALTGFPGEPALTKKNKKDFSVHRDAEGNIIYPIAINSSLRLENLGVIEYDRKNFHTERNIFPIGFKSVREHQSIIKAGDRAEYICEIEDGGTKPTFKVTPSEDPEHPIVKDSSTGCWVSRL